MNGAQMTGSARTRFASWMQTPIFSLPGIIFAVTLIGCEFGHGVAHIAPVQPPTGWDCIERTLRSMPGVRSVTHWVGGGGQRSAVHGGEKAEELHYYSYTGDDGGGIFYFIVSPNGSVLYRNSISTHSKLSQDFIDAILRKMRDLEQTLNGKCGLGNFVPLIQESCSDGTCNKN